MRFLPWKTILFGAFLTNILLAVFMWSNINDECDCSTLHRKHTSYIRNINEKHLGEIPNKNFSQLSENIVIVIREFEFFENDLPETIKSLVADIPSVKIFIITDKIAYPPIEFHDQYKQFIKVINLKRMLNSQNIYQTALDEIDKEHVLIIPDSLRLKSKDKLIKMLETHSKDPNKIIAAPIKGYNLVCQGLNVSLRYWTMKYGDRTEDGICDSIEGLHVLLVTKSLLQHLAFPFARPIPLSIFTQASALKIKTKIIKDVIFEKGRDLFSNPHKKWKHEFINEERKQNLLKDFGIKKIIYPASKVEWYGCNKKTPRCFGTVLGNMPEYLFEGRWTPPCCLENLRQTARYVFGIMDKCGVRYWLEGGSLLGAVRTGDIIPWDYDVDIGIYKEDIEKCEWLKNSQKQSIVDTQGFVWEKATEGNFIRVQFSQTNHLHVDIFPFYPKNGMMTKDTWFPDHKQDMPFPEHYLKPLYAVRFVGVKASAPNNYRDFLELKFGKGSIQNPQYPDPKLLTFSKKH